MLTELKSLLVEIGLSPKEAEIYLSMLELGPSSILDIAKKAGVNRSSTYVMIESLKSFGLISTFEKGRKVMFAAENPEHLREVVAGQMDRLKKKGEHLSDVLPQFLALFASWKDKPRVRYIEGVRALRELRAEIAATPEYGEDVLELFSIDEITTELMKINRDKNVRVVFKVKTRGLISIKPGFAPPFFDDPNTEVRVLDYGKFPLRGGLLVFKNSIYFHSMESAESMIVIEGRIAANFMRCIFNICWAQSTPLG